MYQDRRAIVTGVNGQDGFLSCVSLLRAGYKVFGLARNTNFRLHNLVSCYKSFNLTIASQTYLEDLDFLIRQTMPNLILHWAAPQPKDFTRESEFSFLFLQTSIQRIFDSLSNQKTVPGGTKVLIPGSSEMFAKDGQPKSFKSEFLEANQYSISKLNAMQLARTLSRKYSIDCFFPILYSHESPIRNIEYLSQQIFHFLSCYHEIETDLIIGPKETSRDWSWAPEVIDICIREVLSTTGFRIQVIGSGKLMSLAELIETFATELNCDDRWRIRVKIDPSRVNPSEILGSFADPRTALLTRLSPSYWIREYVKGEIYGYKMKNHEL